MHNFFYPQNNSYVVGAVIRPILPFKLRLKEVNFLNQNTFVGFQISYKT